MHRLRRQIALWVILLAAALPAAGAALTLDEVVSLVKAGVGERIILKQVQSTGTRLVLTVEGILALKSAGASDALIEALMDAPDEAASAQQGPSSRQTAGPAELPFRIYTSASETGEEILHITNLDAQGRRIGGEVEKPDPRTVLSQLEQPAPSPEPRYVEPEYEESAYENSGDSPVVVNIFNPERDYQPSVIPDAGIYGPTYPGGIYPGLFPGYGYGGGYGYNRSCGRRGYGYLPDPAPPGSSTHFKLYHQSYGHGNMLRSTIPQVINTRPYTRGTAHQRNSARFRRP